jgi:NhaP-type Na+/H+ or K+/H+ antiporter
MNDPNVILVIIMGAILLSGLFSALIKESFLPSVPIFMLILGIAIGPQVFDLVNLSSLSNQYIIIEEVCRITLAISLMGVALRIPRSFIPKNWKSLAVILLAVMPLMFLSSGLLVYLIIGLPFWLAMLIGACITPTDPVVTSAIVTGKLAEKNISQRIRSFISTESGANDGLALPFVLLSILILSHATRKALSIWAVDILFYKIGIGLLFGLIIGFLAGYILKKAEDRGIIEQVNFLSYTLALSLLTVGAAELLSLNSIFAVFIAGLAFDQIIKGKERAEEEKFQEAINRFFVLPVFILFGATIPWEAWFNLGFAGLALCIAILFLRRLPFVLGLKPTMNTLHNFRDSLYVGWFGPIGVAAIYYLSFSVTEIGSEIFWEIGTLIVFTSILIHGISATPLTRIYGKNWR